MPLPSKILLNESLRLQKQTAIFRSIENLNPFIKNGSNYTNHENLKVKPFNESTLDIKIEYDFFIFDIEGHENPFIKPDPLLGSFLSEPKIIIPCEPLNSTMEIANKI